MIDRYTGLETRPISYKGRLKRPVKYTNFNAKERIKQPLNYFQLNAFNISMELRRTLGETAQIDGKINFFHSKDYKMNGNRVTAIGKITNPSIKRNHRRSVAIDENSRPL